MVKDHDESDETQIEYNASEKTISSIIESVQDGTSITDDNQKIQIKFAHR